MQRWTRGILPTAFQRAVLQLSMGASPQLPVSSLAQGLIFSLIAERKAPVPTGVGLLATPPSLVVKVGIPTLNSHTDMIVMEFACCDAPQFGGPIT